MTELDHDRRLALAYAPAAARAGLEALWRLDAAMGSALAGGREPLISRIKLAWWRESLEKLDRGPAPAEPVLQALAALVVPRVAGAGLAAMEEGWGVLLAEEALTPTEIDRYAACRGGLLFRHGAALLGHPAGPEVERGGEAWALADLARHCGNAVEGEAALAAARARSGAFRWPSRLRPLGMLAMLAGRDAARDWARLEPPGTPSRMWRMLRHRLTGR